MSTLNYDIVIIGGGHAGAEAAWAACNVLRPLFDESRGLRGRVAMVTMDPARIGQMSCNPAIGGLAKGQIVREIDALGGLMGLAIDATGIQFRMLNASKGPAVRGPRAQADKYAYAREVQRLLLTRANLTILPGTVSDILESDHRIQGVVYQPNPHFDPQANNPARTATSPFASQAGLERGAASEMSCSPDCCGDFTRAGHPGHPGVGHPGVVGCTAGVYPERINCRAVVLTTGTFMRGLMHRGEEKIRGGRIDEKSADTISTELQRLGFELGRLKTGTPPRLDAATLDWASFTEQPGDEHPTPFSDMTAALASCDDPTYARIAERFPVIEQVPCHLTETSTTIHEMILANLDRAPMYNGQIDTTGPRYCPSIEDKVVRFADKTKHTVFLEPESLETREIYCNGISTSLPPDVQEFIVRHLPGCEKATILKYGYAVEYDMVWPHQIDATCMTKRLPGLFLAGQINGTTGYEEAAGQGLLAGLNAARLIRGDDPIRLRRDQAYIGVLMDDLVTKVPREPYRMFTSRAEHRLFLRADNTPERLTELARDWGLLDPLRWHVFCERQRALQDLRDYLEKTRRPDDRECSLAQWAKRPETTEDDLLAILPDHLPRDRRIVTAYQSELKYSGFIDRHVREWQRVAKMEHHQLPVSLDYMTIQSLRMEARLTLDKFRPATLGQASRLAGITPADLTALAMVVR